MTDIWLRYRVTRIRVKASYFGEINSEPRFAALYPYRASTSGIQNVDAVESLPHSTVVAMGTANTGPTVFTRTFNLHDIWKLYDDNINHNYLVGSDLLARQTHFWNKDPNQKVYIVAEMFAFGLIPRDFGGTICLDVQWQCEMTDR